MKKQILIIGIIIILITVGLGGCEALTNKKFVITNKTNAEISVSIWVYDGCTYDDFYDDPNDEFYTTYVDAWGTVTIMREDDISCAYACVYSSGFSQFPVSLSQYFDEHDSIIGSDGGLELIFHQDGTYDSKSI
jgi:hypothetical protein